MPERAFDLIVTTPRNMELAAVNEIESALRDLGDSNPEAWPSTVKGIIFVRTSLSRSEVIEGLRKMAREKPFNLVNVKRVIPVDEVTDTSIEKIVEAAKKLVDRVAESETYRVTVEKRHTELHSMDIIRAVAEVFERKVDLKNPDKIVLVEVIGSVTAVSVVSPGEILSVEKEMEAGG
ncbi:MAG TPA: hypothetical protein ENG69_03315 [Candidatus Korarchaeota archaeon]|nr:hypothetical protein [Candidatus Korarchaeota archaeon]